MVVSAVVSRPAGSRECGDTHEASLLLCLPLSLPLFPVVIKREGAAKAIEVERE